MKEQLLLGVSRANITPEVGGHLYGYSPNVISKSVHDKLTATAFYFESGKTKVLILSVTLCTIKTELSNEITTLIEERYNIPKQNCILHCTHTHSAPNLTGAVGWGDVDKKYYNEIFLPNLVQAIGEAIKSPVAVKMGVASGDSFIGINRRELCLDNQIILGQNPWGPFDPKMTVISFANLDGKVIANIIHYGMHGTCAGINTEISRDWSGVMIDIVEKITGATTAFFNGAEGDVGPRLTNGRTTGKSDKVTGDITYAEQHGAVAGNDAMKIYNNITSYQSVELSILAGEVKVPLKGRITYDLAKAGYEQYKDFVVNIKATLAHYYKTQMELYENGYVDKEFRTVPQTIVRIGDVAFVSFPYELFSEIAMRIAREKKIPHTLSLSNTNGSEGYFVTEDQICRGGYEVGMFQTAYIQPYADNADWHLVNETLKNLDKLNKGE